MDLMRLIGKQQTDVENDPAFIELKARVIALEDMVINYNAQKLVEEFIKQGG